MHIPIRLAGHATAEALVIDAARASCGNINGIGAYLGDVEPYECSRTEPAGFVISWEDFERAYVEIKAARERLATSQSEGAR